MIIDKVNFYTSGEYEIVLHAVCASPGTTPIDGIDDSWSSIVVGTIQLADNHRVIESSYPPHMGTGFVGEEISATFNLPVNCDKPNDNFWFDVDMTQNGEAILSTYYNVYCEDHTIYMMPTGDGV
jgi:hypothetical protein